MTARILVVDDIPANVKLLEVRLLAEYFDVVTASNGPDALEICARGGIDIVLLDIMMPGMDGFDVCRKLKAEQSTAHIPVVMVTALDQMSDRVQGLEAGADDFLTKPVNDVQLLTRLRSLVRLKMLGDELRLRASTTRDMGIQEFLDRNQPAFEARPSVLLVDERAASQARMTEMLQPIADVELCADPQQAVFRAAEGNFDCVIASARFDNFDPLRLCSQLRSLDRTRLVPVILIVEAGEDELVARAFDLGVNDYLMRPVDEQELAARLRTQVRRKRYTEHLRSSMAQTIELAITDPLTGLHNRRYLDNHFDTLFARANARRRDLSVMITDIDRFKLVNDAHGHLIGDQVLVEFARRLRKNVRGIDLACRFGGEEFVVLMPDTDHATALLIAERVRKEIEGSLFAIGDGPAIAVTASVGVASLSSGDGGAQSLMARADSALYEAKRNGRNQVVAKAA